MSLFRNKFRVESARLPGYNYRHPGYYFVTICTKDRICFFGDIYDHQMQLSRCGDFANRYWIEIPQHCPMVKLDEFVIMPNHVHGIIRILDPNGNNAGFPYPFLPYEFMPGNVVDTVLANNYHETNPNGESGSIQLSEALFVSPENPDDLEFEIKLESELDWMVQPTSQRNKNQFMSEMSPKKGSLSAIVRSYKSAVAYDSHKIDSHFDWHIRFHDRIIRNPFELYRIRKYIRNNPKKWNNDRFFQ